MSPDSRGASLSANGAAGNRTIAGPQLNDRMVFRQERVMSQLLQTFPLSTSLPAIPESGAAELSLPTVRATSPASLPLDGLAASYAKEHGSECALSAWSASHFWHGLVIAEILLFCVLTDVHAFLLSLSLFVTGSLFVLITFRLSVVVLSLIANPQITVSRRQVEETLKSELPMYTILVPLYREENVAGGIVRALGRLEYPRHRLDIKLLLEDDDQLTIDAVEKLELGPEYDVIRVRPGHPRTKPKACNYGLERATGEYLVIFDAEDRPEPDQLLKVVHGFRTQSSDVACIQAKLNYYNARENLLTRCFALEYTVWFDMLLPGLQQLNGPIPLGGTSNHFRTEILRSTGGWDPFNVTEDCDLGVRLATRQYRTVLIDSTTFEEANTEVGNWIRQRSRWIKGYMQTQLVHTKEFLGTFRKLGIRKTILFHLSVGGVAAQSLLNLLCWPFLLLFAGLLCWDVLSGRDIWTVIAGSRDEYRSAWKLIYSGGGEDPTWAAVSQFGFAASVVLLLCNVFFVAINLLACRIRNYHDLWLAALLSPFYWLLGSYAAWKGGIQLLHKPHYWEKTIHGLTSLTEPASQEEVSQS